MREEVISSGGTNNVADPTPAASSVGASSPAVPANIGSGDWSGHGPGSKTGSLTCVGAQFIRPSLSTNAGGSALVTSQPSCRPWERGDLLRRLATFKPSNWFGKPKAANSLACARRGWMNVDIDKIECETCGANLKYHPSIPWMSTESDGTGEEFAKQLDLAHKGTCPWSGNICPESLVQFPPTPPSALIGGYKDRCDGLLQFVVLPVVAASAIEQIRISRGPQIERLLANSFNPFTGDSSIKMECVSAIDSKDELFSTYSRAQKLISLCGWEPRWLSDVQDCEDHSAQSARNGCSVGPSKDRSWLKDLGQSKKAFSTTAKKDYGKNDATRSESKCESRVPLLDCSLCGATVRIWDFVTVTRPARVIPNGLDIPETSKKAAITRGVSAASGISGWNATDGGDKDNYEFHDEAETTDNAGKFITMGVDLNLTMGGGLSSTQLHMPEASQKFHDERGKDLMIGQPANSDACGRAASIESHGPSTRKRSLDEGASTVDRPNLMIRPADSVEGTVIDRDGDEVDGGQQYSAGPSKRFRDTDFIGRSGSSFRWDSSGAGPSNSQGFGIDTDLQKFDAPDRGTEQLIRFPSTRESTHASSVIAMDTICHSADDDSMESVENYPGDMDDFNCPSTSVPRNPDAGETSETQAQQSACFQPAPAPAGGEMGVSSTIDGEEVLNTETATVQATRDGLSVGASGGSVGMGASHEAEIHGTDLFVNRSDSGAGDVELVAEVVENQGQTGDFAPEPGSATNDFAEGRMDREDPHGDSQDVMSRSMGRADSGSKVVGSTKAESIESGEKTSDMQMIGPENSAHPSLSCNAIMYSGREASKEEVTQGGKSSPTDECAYAGPDCMGANGIGPPNVESNYEEGAEFDPIKHHHIFCPWVNGNVAAAGCAISSTSTSAAIALCGWELTVDALDASQLVGQISVQPVESESTASLYKDDLRTAGQKLISRHSFSKKHN